MENKTSESKKTARISRSNPEAVVLDASGQKSQNGKPYSVPFEDYASERKKHPEFYAFLGEVRAEARLCLKSIHDDI
jgi:hypothetical protein